MSGDGRATRRSGLGRGLSALIPDSGAPAAADSRIPTSDVPIDAIVPNPEQPRVAWDEGRLSELTASIRAHGVIQPLLVSEQRDPSGATVYQLIAGERRLRAARAAGLERVPVTIRQTTPQKMLELAIVENVQRADLSPLEEAHAYQRLCDEFGLNQREVGERVGRSRTAIANTLRLLELPVPLRDSLAAGEISEGHARALLGLPTEAARVEAWDQVRELGLNVRQTESLVREWRQPAPPETATDGAPELVTPPPAPAGVTSGLPDGIEQALQRTLGTRVQLRRSRTGRGSVTIHFYSDEELDGLLERLLDGTEL
ncbi:MAG: ParB/RepB/Spo0J family partition protein [Chloroflexi bacterium]|nr:ParB/RepB/Spo0J family partition protein [Chloroflexota bacterium]MDA1002826.1 ParB/RepB/Spo0J family partition protein [Chloroflexota bacterium]